MIAIDKRKEIFIRYFVKYHKVRLISRELCISRNTVTKIIDDMRVKINELDLQNESNLLPYIDSIVIQPNRTKRVVSKYKVKDYHLKIIKKLVIENERTRVISPTYKKNHLQLYQEFLKINNEYREDVFSYYTFYNVARQIKKDLEKH